MDIERGGTLPIPCRHCGRFIRFKVETGVFPRACESCQKITVVTCRAQGPALVILTAPGGTLIRRP